MSASGQPYDRNIVSLLLQSIRQGGQRVNINEFLGAYVEGEMKLKDRLNEAIKVVLERRRQVDIFRENLNDAKVTTPKLT